MENTKVATLDTLVKRVTNLLAGGDTGVEYVTSGIPSFDRGFGGFERRVVSVIGARPATGKTVAAVHISASAAKAGHKVLLVSSEDPAIRSCHKFLAWDSGPLFARDNLTQVLDPAKWGSYTAPAWMENITYTEENRSWVIARMISDGDFSLAVIDFAQNLVSGVADRMTPAHGDRLLAQFKPVSAQANVAIVLMSQLKRPAVGQGGETDTRPPTKEDLKGSGAYEEGAKCAVLLHRTASKPGEIQWIVDKSSFAPPQSPIKLVFDGPRSRLWDTCATVGG